VAPQSGAKQKFYYIVYNINLNSNCELREHLKMFLKIVEDRAKEK